MTNSTLTPPTTASIAVTMFSVTDQDAAHDFYVGRLGWEVRSDARFGPEQEYRWLEVAPVGSAARLAVNPPMGGPVGTGGIGIEVPDVLAEHARLSALPGLDIDPAPMQMPGAPLMFALRDPDGNHLWIVAAAG